ncbi:PRC-barrel domain-containing protein [Bacillus mojavensis]
MRTCHEVVGFPVYSEQTSVYLGTISDICFSLEGNCLGFILEQKRLFHNHHVLLRACDIICILHDRILAAVNAEQLLPLPKSCFTYEQMKMKLVKSQEGDILGMLEDVYFCLDRGIIVAYELSDGFFSDLAGCKRHIQRADSLVEVRKDEIVLNG